MTDESMSLESMEQANQTASDNVNAEHFKEEPAPIIAPNEAKQVNSEAKWKYDENVEGTGDQPDWFLVDKYASIAQQAEAYPELLKKFGEFSGKPKDGYNLESYSKTIDTESPFVHKLLEASENLNMSQGGLEEILNLFVDYEKANTPDQEEFVKSLNTQEMEMAKNVHNWALNNFTEEESEVISTWLSDKNALNILSKMRGMSREFRIPNSSVQQNTVPLPTLADLESLVSNNWDKYKNDEAFRTRIERQRQMIFERGGSNA